jgi:glycosyltransferase involved in cell wall biosynthesis
MTRPAVTICIPSHRPKLLAECLASVEKQTSDDVAVRVLASRGWWREKFADLLDGVRSEYFLLLCDDDVLEPQCVARLLMSARASNADVTYSDVTLVGERSDRVAMRDWNRANFAGGAPCWITALVRTSLYHSLGGFDDRLVYGDWDFYYRAFKAGAVAHHVHDALWRYRVHAKQGSVAVDAEAARAAIYAKHPELHPAVREHLASNA